MGGATEVNHDKRARRRALRWYTGAVTRVIWASKKNAEVLSLEGERVELRSECPFAPGTPAAGSLAAHPEQPITVKVHGCRRDGDSFLVTGRVINFTRALRALLTAQD